MPNIIFHAASTFVDNGLKVREKGDRLLFDIGLVWPSYN